MLQLKNATPFCAELAVLPDERGVDTLIVTVKGTFELGPPLTVADQQVGVVFADEYWGEPGDSSLKYAAEVHLPKRSTDVAVVGSAQVADRRPTSQLDVSVSVADVVKVVRVFGDRFWTGRRLGAPFTPPEPFDAMPLVFERAFGGTHAIDPDRGKVRYEARNPVGCGFAGKRKRHELKDMPLPNLEDPACPLRTPRSKSAPAGFGFIAPGWEPRRSYAGTYDETWQRTRAPHLPADFDLRFFNAAHPDLICARYLAGGEAVSVLNAWEGGPLHFALPVCEFELNIYAQRDMPCPPPQLETVLIEPDESRLCMLWRAATSCDKSVLQIRQAELELKRLAIDGGTV
jgi:hypothetical protein